MSDATTLATAPPGAPPSAKSGRYRWSIIAILFAATTVKDRKSVV